MVKKEIITCDICNEEIKDEYLCYLSYQIKDRKKSEYLSIENFSRKTIPTTDICLKCMLQIHDIIAKLRNKELIKWKDLLDEQN